MSVATKKKSSTLVGMGEIATGQGEEELGAVLGSCIGIVIYEPSRKCGAMAHVVLGDSAGRAAAPGKFADTAIPGLLDVLAREGVLDRKSMIAKLCGGAAMFAGGGSIQIGDANAAAVKQALQKVNIPVIAEDVGGTKGRRVRFHCDTGQLHVEVVGQTSTIL